VGLRPKPLRHRPARAALKTTRPLVPGRAPTCPPRESNVAIGERDRSPVQETKPASLSGSAGAPASAPWTAFAYPLGTTHLRRTALLSKPFCFLSPLASHEYRCYFHQDPHRGGFQGASRRTLPHAPPRPPTLRARRAHPARRRSFAPPLQRHPFSGLTHSAGELLHTPWRVPTSMATFLLSKCVNAFCGL